MAFHHNAFSLHPIHQYAQRLVKAYVSYVLGFFYGRHGIENILAEESIGNVGVYREVANAEASEVLEEVRTLARVYPIVFQRHLDNDACRTDMWPFYGYTQPKIARTPTSWSYENVVAVGAKKATVDAFHIFGYAIVVGSREVIIVFNIHHIGYVVAYAMPQRVVRAQ